MTILLLGHGKMLHENVAVPDHLRISFLVDSGFTAELFSGAGYILNVDYLTKPESGFSYHETIGPGGTVPNHDLAQLDTFTRSVYAQIDPEDNSCWYAGEHFNAPIRLCNDPGQCRDGVHTCGGLFSFSWPSDHLVWVACRNLPPPTQPKHAVGIGNPENLDFYDYSIRIEEFFKKDQIAFERYFDSLSLEEQAMALISKDVQRWAWLRTGKKFLQEHGEHEFYLMARSDKTFQDYRTDDDLNTAFKNGRAEHERRKEESLRRRAEREQKKEDFAEFARLVPTAKHLLKNRPSAFPGWVASLPKEQWAHLARHPEVGPHVKDLPK